MIFALVGNQNCGKTTLFNALTGSNQHVGNFPGVTVDRKDGMISTAAKVRGRRGVQQRLIELATELAAKHPGEEYNLVVCDGNVPEEGAALEAALTRALPNAHRVLHGKIDATLAVHLGPNLLGVGVQFLNSKLPA